MDVFSTLGWPWLVYVFFFSHNLGISHNLISFMLEILYNCSDKAKSSSFLYQSVESATSKNYRNVHSVKYSQLQFMQNEFTENIFKSILRRQRQTFRIPKKKRFTIEFCRCHQMNHNRPCPNVRGKDEKDLPSYSFTICWWIASVEGFVER